MSTPSDDSRQVLPMQDLNLEHGVLMAYNYFEDDDEKERLCCGARNWSYPVDGYLDQGFRIVWSLALAE